MKILQVIFSLSSGGAEKTVVNLCNELAKNHEVYLCIINTDEIEKNAFYKSQLNPKIHYINFGSKRGINIKSFYTIVKLMYDIKPNIVHAHLNTLIYLYLPALIFNNKIQFIHTLHNIASKTIGFSWQKSINQFYYKRDLIKAVAISQECKHSFIELYRNNNIRIVENGIPKPRKSKLYRTVKNEITSFKRNSNDIVFIHVGRYSEQKNQEILIKVFNQLLAEGNNIILLIIGIEKDSDGERILKNQCSEGIYFLGLKTNISDYLLNADVFVLSSLWEGLPISLLEAISCGVIPVCTPAGGIPDVIKNEKIGFLSKDFTEEGLKLAILKCLNNIDSFEKKNLYEYFKSSFSIEKCSKEYETIYY
jgi:glycosyltransferase involved in cell wall biosynthesis